jgi:hypothetical protein
MTTDSTPTPADPLKPCPFCGGDASCCPDDIGSGGQHLPPYLAGCSRCRLFFVEEEEKDAISAWNRRATPPAAAEPLSDGGVEISRPGASIRVTEHRLTAAGRAALSVPVPAVDWPTTDMPHSRPFITFRAARSNGAGEFSAFSLAMDEAVAAWVVANRAALSTHAAPARNGGETGEVP